MASRSGPADNEHPWAARTCEDLLNEVVDPVARKYLKVSAHSDLATEPHLTSGLYGLRKLVMSIPGYGALYSIAGGMEELPHNALHSVEWSGEPLRRSMASHTAAYDRPGHYLRISLLFDRPFWRSRVTGSWFMLDAFGGCCVYDEGARFDTGEYGVLGWLLAGADALSQSNAEDETLIGRAIESLPVDLAEEAKARLLEGRVHRWLGAVSGQREASPCAARVSPTNPTQPDIPHCSSWATTCTSPR
jgi:hypothetical protein